MAIKEYFDYRRAALAAFKVGQVKTTLEEVTLDQNIKLDKVANKVEEVHIATNGMKAKLEEESYQRGMRDERHKQDGK